MLKNIRFRSHYCLRVLTVLTSCVHETQAASDQAAVPVQVRTPAVVERAESVSASGSVEGSETADVAFQVGGRVARVLVEEGQHVSKGQLLAEIEPTDYRNAFNAATAQKEAALAVAQKADAGLRKQELEQARIDFDRCGRRIQAHEVPRRTKESSSERLSEDRGGVQRRARSAMTWPQEGTRHGRSRSPPPHRHTPRTPRRPRNASG